MWGVVGRVVSRAAPVLRLWRESRRRQRVSPRDSAKPVAGQTLYVDCGLPPPRLRAQS